MRKTSMKISWDILWEVNSIRNDLSKKHKRKVTQDQTVRHLCEFYKKNAKNGLLEEIKLSEPGHELKKEDKNAKKT